MYSCDGREVGQVIAGRPGKRVRAASYPAALSGTENSQGAEWPAVCLAGHLMIT